MTQPVDIDGSRPNPSPVDVTPLCDGRFVPFRRLGAGSQGDTYEAVDRANGRTVALKRFDVHGASSWKDVELAEREARVLQSIEHPALPGYVTHFEHGGALYLAMEKIEGEDLAQLVARGMRLSFDDLFQLVATLADVFAYLHGRVPPLVHRDIKPSNLIRRSNGSFVLIDFGSVRDGLRPQGGSTVVGTFGYMAPEQFQGRAMPATDLYGLGATLMTLLTGMTPDKLPHRGLEIDVRSSLPSNTPEPWLNLLERLVSADPEKRMTDLTSLLPTLRSIGAPHDVGDERGQTSEPFETSGRRSSNQAGQARSAEWQTANRRVEWAGARPLRLPFPILLLLNLLRVALFLVLQVVLPVLFTVLSLPFGRSLRRTANDIMRSGQYADRQLAHLLSRVSTSSGAEWQRATPAGGWNGEHAYGPHPHAPFGSNPEGKRRVVDDDIDVESTNAPMDSATTTKRRNVKR
ncbi:MAG: serine/threonine-protein kinase [Polyangiaceae bacterium]